MIHALQLSNLFRSRRTAELMREPPRFRQNPKFCLKKQIENSHTLSATDIPIIGHAGDANKSVLSNHHGCRKYSDSRTQFVKKILKSGIYNSGQTQSRVCAVQPKRIVFPVRTTWLRQKKNPPFRESTSEDVQAKTRYGSTLGRYHMTYDLTGDRAPATNRRFQHSPFL